MQKRTYVPFVLLLVFVLPMITAWVCYHYYSYFQFKTTNHGTLLRPPLPLDGYRPQKWQLLLISNGACDAGCQQTFFSLQQVVKLLGKDQERVVVRKIAPGSDQGLKAYSWIDGRVYLIDPLGNVFMYYVPGARPLDVLDDLKRLLEVSQIG